ncbi:MAG: alkyl hydroperoxide reductase/Thiol specific antioxidant/Mal allergen [Crocinitomicaceae bacterium]|jgi:peroxiredoxin Q/BCP|nr:alkyl hydroperoxide reductase/Thiol specific antioxidant/Mal allergen [Crocinitomicaceae bacterium]
MTLQPGKYCPAFVMENQHGELIDMEDYLHYNNIVLYFYPKDETGGCTRQACAFRDQLEEFNALDAVVLGISPDSVSSHKDFAEKHRLNFHILSDPGRKVARMFGIVYPLIPFFPRRVTFVIDRKGKIVNSFEKLQNSKEHLEFARQELEKLRSSY